MREYARARQLPVADKPDSQEICFIPDHDYAAFVTQRATRPSRTSGAIVDEGGRVLGRHGGIHRFTVGQRKGLGLVVARRPARRCTCSRSSRAIAQVVVGPKASLERTTLTASGVNWIARAAGGAAPRHRADPPSSSGRAGDRACARAAADARRAEVDLRRAADRRSRRPGRRLLSTETWWSAEVGSTEVWTRFRLVAECGDCVTDLRDVRACLRGSARRRARPCSPMPAAVIACR